MKGFFLGLVVGIGLMFILNITGHGDPQSWGLFGKNTGIPAAVAPQNLVKGATEFGTLKVIVSSNEMPVADVEIDVGLAPGGNMAIAKTGKDGVAIFERMPAGDFVVFFNDYNFFKNFQRVSSLTPVSIIAEKTTEQKIELTAK